MSLPEEYAKIWTIEDFITPVDYGLAGTVRYWKVLKRYEDGDVLIERRNRRALLFGDQIKNGEYHYNPTFFLPSGLHLGVEYGYRRTWYGRHVKHAGGFSTPDIAA